MSISHVNASATTPPVQTVDPRWPEVLRALREARGITLDGWGARLGVSRTTVQRWERGERAPDPGAEVALLAYCREANLFRAYDRGPLAGVRLTAEWLQELLAAARWRVDRHPAAAAATDERPPAPTGIAPLGPPNLPLHLTSFVGRGRELTEVTDLLAGTRLLTLTGAGGCGKTRLALELAGTLRDAYADGVWWVDLAPLTDQALLSQVIASALQVRASGSQPVAEALSEALRSRQGLLLLDNVEHLLPAAAELVETLLRACPRLSVVATSRESLGVSGEVVWRVPPLSFPHRPAEVDDSDAMRLFIERARLRRPDFQVTSAEATAVDEICRRLDGMPLAIELAAARVNLLSVGQILDRLHDRFQLLTSGGRRSLPRHQTLRAAMDWSYALLTEPERVVLRALAVFAGGFTLEAAEAVCGTTDGEPWAVGEPILAEPTIHGSLPVAPSDVLDLVMHLVDKSLVVAEEQGGAVRYRLLETVRQYAAEQLAGAGEERALRERHALWCLALAEMAAPHKRNADQEVWLERLTVEHDNLRAALAWCLADERGIALGPPLAGALGWFWLVRGHLSEGRRWLAAAITRGDAVPAGVRATALRAAGNLATDQGDYDEAERLLEAALSLHRELGDETNVALLLHGLGNVMSMRGDHHRARVLLNQGLALGRKLGDASQVAKSLNSLGIAARQLGDPDAALVCYEECLALMRRLGDTRGIAVSLQNLGNVHQDQRLPDQAAARYREALSLYRELGDRRGIASCLQGLASVAVLRDDAERAARLCGAAAAQRAAIGFRLAAFGREKFEGTVASARAALSEEAFTEAWLAGQALTLDDAIAEALSDGDGSAVDGMAPPAQQDGRDP